MDIQDHEDMNNKRNDQPCDDQHKKITSFHRCSVLKSYHFVDNSFMKPIRLILNFFLSMMDRNF